jgi:type IV pilus assembly protein PilB
VREKLASQRSILAIVKELGYVSEEQQRAALRKHQGSIRLGALLVELNYLQPADLRAALALQKETGNTKKLGEILLEHGIIEEYRLIEVLSDQLGFANIEPEFAVLDKQLLQRVTPRWCRQHSLIPLHVENGNVLIAFADPLDRKARQEASQIFAANVIPFISSRRSLDEAIAAFERHFKLSSSQKSVIESGIIDLVNDIIIDALEAEASDIHIEPLQEQLRVRFRRDGVLTLHKNFDKRLALAVASRLKVLAKADIAEKRRHQDGRIVFEHPKTSQLIDLRASFYVTLHGEKTVLRLLRKSRLLSLDSIGFFPRILQHFYQNALDMPSGVILITGPTGTGKTTTLYGCVNYLNSIDRSIITAEDPVEYMIDGVTQCSINPKIDVTFENTLPYIVRQDPDVIVLGEIRDNFSADAAIQAALTGHKILTTFHTEDTVGSLLRLMNMDIETFLIASTVVAVVSQRLVRKLCPHCAQPYRPTPADLQRLGYMPADLGDAEFKNSVGCRHCRYTGYQGRIGVFELLILDELVKDAILQKKTSYDIRRISLESTGMVTLLEDGIAKAAHGETTLSEVIRHLPRLSKPRPLSQIKRLLKL